MNGVDAVRRGLAVRPVVSAHPPGASRRAPPEGARSQTRWLILGAVLVAAFGLSPARAARGPPGILLDGPSRLSVGDSVTVRGESWTNECNDTTVCGNGGSCSGDDCVGGEPERPLRNITILLTPARGQEGAQLVLAEGVDAALDLTFDRHRPRP